MENMTGALVAVGGRRITIMKKIPEYFGCKVFDDREMKAFTVSFKEPREI